MTKEKEEKKKEKSPKEELSVLSGALENEFGLNIEEMALAGLHLGHRVSKIHPKMNPYIFGVRNSVHVIDLDKTLKKFEEALEFMKKLISENKIILFVGTKVQTKELIKDAALTLKMPYVDFRWLGGTFTNFETIKKRVDYFLDLKEKREKGELEKYTKKERADIDKELKILETKFGGIRDLKKLPEAIFILDIQKEDTAVREAKRKGIKMIALVDTNDDPTPIDYLIPANNDALSSIKYILEIVKKTLSSVKIIPAEPAEPKS